MGGKIKTLKRQLPFSRNHLILFISLFAIVGGFILLNNFAATTGLQTGASLASCSTTPCQAGSFSVGTGWSCGTSNNPSLQPNVIQLGAINNLSFNENYCYAWYHPSNINTTPAATVILFSHC